MCVGSLNIDVWWVWFYLWVNELDEFVSVEFECGSTFIHIRDLCVVCDLYNSISDLKIQVCNHFEPQTPDWDQHWGLFSLAWEGLRVTGWENRIHAVVWRSREFWIKRMKWGESFQYSCYLIGLRRPLLTLATVWQLCKATMFGWPWKSRSTSGSEVGNWWLCLMDLYTFFYVYVFEVTKSTGWPTGLINEVLLLGSLHHGPQQIISRGLIDNRLFKIASSYKSCI